MPEEHSVTLPAVVDKIIESPDPEEPDKAQINIQEGADPLYKEIRIKNSLADKNGNEINLKEGEEVQVKVQTEKETQKDGTPLPKGSSPTSPK
jgi:hypothetical protein